MPEKEKPEPVSTQEGMWFTRPGSKPAPPRKKPERDPKPGGVVSQVETKDFTD